MKKQLFLSTALAVSLGTFAHAQQAVTLTTGDQEITVNNTIKEPQLIPIELVRDPQTGKVIARLAATQNAGTTLELGRMTLEGQSKETAMGDKKRIEIIWDTAALLDDKTGEKKTTPFTIPFKSEVVAKPNLEQGDEFNAEGDPIELMLAYQRLIQEKLEEEEEEEKEETETEDDPEKSGAPSEKGTDENRDFESPNFDVAEEIADPVITTVACPIQVDLAQMAAIVMEETLVDGKSEGGCQETLTRYPITPVTNGCTLTPDVDNMIMIQQERYVYTDPNAGEVQAQGCTDNPDLSLPITETTEGCGIFHDFDAGLSTQQTKLTYEHQGVVQTLQTCQNSDTTFAHIVTRNGCNPIVNHSDSTVTFTEKTLIDVDGAQQEILGCLPDASSSIAINEEECTGGNRYSHNYDSNQSFLNKTYFYNDPDSGRVDVLTCEPSDVTFAHAIDETLCNPTHDDVAKISTLRGKTVIDDGGQVVIGQCQDIAPIIPYVDIGAQWKTNTTAVSNLQLAASDNQYLSLGGQHGNWGFNLPPVPQSSTWFKNFSYTGTVQEIRYRPWNIPRYVISPAKTGDGNNRIYDVPRVVGNAYCLRGEILGNWDLANGATIDKANSTTTPDFTGGVSFGAPQSTTFGGVKQYSGIGTITYNCSQPTCTVATMRAHPIWQRGDLSEYVDTDTTLEVKYLCGDGSNLDGQSY